MAIIFVDSSYRNVVFTTFHVLKNNIIKINFIIVLLVSKIIYNEIIYLPCSTQNAFDTHPIVFPTFQQNAVAQEFHNKWTLQNVLFEQSYYWKRFSTWTLSLYYKQFERTRIKVEKSFNNNNCIDVNKNDCLPSLNCFGAQYTKGADGNLFQFGLLSCSGTGGNGTTYYLIK